MVIFFCIFPEEVLKQVHLYNSIYKEMNHSPLIYMYLSSRSAKPFKLNKLEIIRFVKTPNTVNILKFF